MPVVAKKQETDGGEEPVIYFQDRLRPRKVVEPVAAKEPEPSGHGTIQVDRAPMYGGACAWGVGFGSVGA